MTSPGKDCVQPHPPAAKAAMAYEPSRGGVRGGKDQFDWDDVKVDKHRENYLAHSLMAPVGRWQKGKDLTWYNKQSISARDRDALKNEMVAIKKAEEEAMAIALGLKTASSIKGGSALSRQEIAEVCKRRESEDGDPGGDDRIAGVGFKSRRAIFMAAGTSSSKDGVTTFEHDPTHQQATDRLFLNSRHSKDRRISEPDSTTGPDHIPRKDAEHSKKKHKKEKKKKKNKDRTKYGSESERGERRRKKQKKVERHSVKGAHNRRQKHDSSGSEEYSGSKRQRRDSVSTDSEEDRRFEQRRRGATRRDEWRRRRHSDSDEDRIGRRQGGNEERNRKRGCAGSPIKRRRCDTDSEEEERARTFGRDARGQKHLHRHDNKDRPRGSHRHQRHDSDRSS